MIRRKAGCLRACVRGSKYAVALKSGSYFLGLDGCCQLPRMQTQILAHFELYAVNFSEKPRHCSPVIDGVGLRVAQVCHLSLELGNTLQGDFELLIVRKSCYAS